MRIWQETPDDPPKPRSVRYEKVACGLSEDSRAAETSLERADSARDHGGPPAVGGYGHAEAVHPCCALPADAPKGRLGKGRLQPPVRETWSVAGRSGHRVRTVRGRRGRVALQAVDRARDPEAG